MTKFRRLFFAATLVTAATCASAQAGFQDLEALDALVANALDASVGEAGGAARPIDRRLRLQPCPVTPEVSAPAQGAVAVRCGSTGWRLSVALVRSGQAPNVVAQSPNALARAPGQMRTDPMIIHRGDQVQLVIMRAGFSVATTATATDDAAVGQRTRVTVEGRRQPYIGTVLADGRVRL